MVLIVIGTLFKCGISKVTSRDDTMVTVLASYQCGLGLIPARCHMWIEFVAGSHLGQRVFLWALRFSFLHVHKT